jgi:histidine triad (HIT) family protein
MGNGTIFSQIIRGELPADIVFENDRILAFKDINPVAPVHLLIVPKKEIPDLQSVAPEDLPLMGEIVEIAQALAEVFGVADGYRLITNNGSMAGQVIFHLHFHLIGGRKLGPLA